MIWDPVSPVGNTSPFPSSGYSLNTGGEPLQSLRNFLAVLWKHLELQAMLAPMQSPGCCGVFPQVINDSEQTGSINPYAPVISINAAGLIDELIEAYPTGTLAAVLRPCELRTYVELRKRREANRSGGEPSRDLNRLLIISVDCPGTLDTLKFSQRAAKTDIPTLTHEALAWTGEDKPSNGSLRSACQQCELNLPLGADLTISYLGSDPAQKLLLLPADQAVAKWLVLEKITDGPALSSELELRRATAAQLLASSRNQEMSVGAEQVQDTSSLLSIFARCTLCGDCLDACPLYDGELASMLGLPGTSGASAPLLVNLVGISRWLASCSGCGLCEDVCSRDIPLLSIFLGFNKRIRSELNYFPGDPGQKLPWT